MMSIYVGILISVQRSEVDVEAVDDGDRADEPSNVHELGGVGNSALWPQDELVDHLWLREGVQDLVDGSVRSGG